MHRD
jgi:hypothetical protein